MKIAKLIGTVAVISALFATSAHAQLVIGIDTAAETLTLSGSDSGTLDGFLVPSQDAYRAQWEAVNLGDSDQPSESIGLTPANVSSSGGGPVITGGLLTSAIAWTRAEGGAMVLNLYFGDAASTPASQTINFFGPAISYSSLDSVNKANFESLIGSSLTLSRGSGFGDIQVQAIPEPSASSLVVGLGLFGLLTRRRRSSLQGSKGKEELRL